MNIYISGPILGTTDYEERFRRTAEKIKKCGHTPIDPLKITREYPGSSSWTDAECLAYEIGLLSECDAIYLMKGWKHSGGAQVEARFAERVGIPRFYLEDVELDPEWTFGGNV